MTQNTQQIQRPNASGPQENKGKLRFGAANAAAVVLVSSALIFAGLAKTCKPGPEKISKKEKVCAVCAPLPSAPKKGDNKCEVDKGEHDPASAAFDLASCGYCGDGKQQDWETKEACPVDFRCEKGDERYKKTVFGAYKPLDNGKLELTTVTITENCRKDDKPPSGRKPPRTTTVVTPRPVVITQPVVNASGKCTEQPSGQLTGIKRTIRRNLTIKTDYLWNSGTIPSDKTVTVVVKLNVTGTGHVSGVSISGAGKTISPGSVGLSGLNGMYIGYPTGSSCSITVPKTIPRKDR